MTDALTNILIEQASPVLLGCKPGALFALSYDTARELLALSKDCGCAFAVKVIRRQGACLQVLLYQEELLRQALQQPAASAILAHYRYPQEFDAALNHLQKRICLEAEFPHEVGLFLGYPPEDVTGFLLHGGRGCKLCGTWKVYGDVEEAQTRFVMFETCRQSLARHVAAGGCLQELCFSLVR